MARYRKKGQIDLYEKEKSSAGSWVLAIFIILMVIAGLSDDKDTQDSGYEYSYSQ